MATITSVGSGPTAVTTTAATIHTGGTLHMITAITIANIHTSTTGTIEVSIASSTTVSTATAILSVVPIPPNTTLIVHGPWKLASTNINAKASANSIFVMTVAGYSEA